MSGDIIGYVVVDNDLPGTSTMSDIYYRVIAETGVAVTLQDCDEKDYDPAIWLRDFNGEPLRFSHAGDAEQNYFRQIREVNNALRIIGESFGKLTIPEDSLFLAHKLVGHFQLTARNIINNEKSN